MKRLALICCTYLVFCFGSVAGHTDEPPVSGKTAKQSLVAFQCATLASFAKNTEEAERLFLYGYEQGKAFIGAISEKNITEEEVQKAPLSILLTLQGPNPDFMLGRIYEYASESTYDSITDRMKKEGVSETYLLTNVQLRGSWARNMFNEQHCSLIGQ